MCLARFDSSVPNQRGSHLKQSLLALGAGLILSLVGAFSGFDGVSHAGHDHSSHSPLFERQLDRNADNLELSTQDLEAPVASEAATGEDEIIIWNPISGSVSSGCTLSGCLGSLCGGSGCGGSGCAGSGCGLSGCGGSACGGSACGGSACAASGCGLSFCLGSVCGLSGCAGSICTQSGCVGSACLVSGCKVSICIVSGCEGSLCVGSICKDSYCVGSVNCKKNCLKQAQQAFADNPAYGQEYSWWVAYGRGVNPGGWVPYLYLDPVTAEAVEMPQGTYTIADESLYVYVDQTIGSVIDKDQLVLGDDGEYQYLDEETGEMAVAVEVAPFMLTMTDENGDEIEIPVYENPLTFQFFDPATGEILEFAHDIVAPFIEAYGQPPVPNSNEEPVYAPSGEKQPAAK